MGEKQVKLIPYTIQQVVEHANETPEGVRLVQAPEIWEESNHGDGIIVAVIDTGIDTNHPDLKDRIIGGRNFTTDFQGNPDLFEDNNGHGTHVSGTIVASLNQQGVSGVAPKAKILGLKALTGEGSGNYDWIIAAINYAVKWRGPQNERVRVICMSLGGPVDVPEMHQAIQRAVQQEISVVVAAGNEGDGEEETTEFSYPGAYAEVISTGAVSLNYQLAPFSNTHSQIDLVAPGVEVLSTYPGNKYAKLSGTSMAAPHIAGALALLINLCENEFNRSLSETEVYAQLIKRTVPLGFIKSSEGNGFLMLNLVEKLSEFLVIEKGTSTIS